MRSINEFSSTVTDVNVLDSSWSPISIVTLAPGRFILASAEAQDTMPTARYNEMCCLGTTSSAPAHRHEPRRICRGDPLLHQ